VHVLVRVCRHLGHRCLKPMAEVGSTRFLYVFNTALDMPDQLSVWQNILQPDCGVDLIVYGTSPMRRKHCLPTLFRRIPDLVRLWDKLGMSKKVLWVSSAGINRQKSPLVHGLSDVAGFRLYDYGNALVNKIVRRYKAYARAPTPVSSRSLTVQLLQLSFACSFGLPILDLWHSGLRATPDQFEKTGNGGRCVVHAEGRFFETVVAMAASGLVSLCNQDRGLLRAAA
jgi:hypothetical protein